MRILGLDVGEKRIGIARADSDTRIAIPVGYVEVNGSEWQEIARIANLNSTAFFVVGLPRSNEGTETQQSLFVRNFAKVLVEKIPGAKIRFQDESLTSVVAEERLKKSGRAYQKGDIDAEAAAIILQDFLENFSTSAPSEVPEAKIPDEVPTGVMAGVVSAVTDARDTAANLTKKQSDKVKLKTKKAKHKMKTATKWVSGVAILLILGVIATGVALFIKEQRHLAYQEWVAEQEAQMEADVFNFTIRPGETIFDVEKNLIAVGYSATEVKQALEANYDFAFLKGRPTGATLEGYLYGETHEFYRGTPVEEVIKTYLEGMGRVIAENDLEARYAAQGLSLYEGITLASMVQKEATASDMPTVAQVFLTRLNYGMLLGSDVTVSYALDVVDPYRQVYGDNVGAVSVDSCYNTRLYQGLPCGPISNPGIEALLAVAQPTDTSYLYFLTGDDGLMYYSYTEDEHLQNAAVHCQNLCSVSL
ncbi:endolytic transglycosylase MltG [Candidatus Saccharibacteria bacterium]|nr:endolytic transglycosylase MltG [Candidatus Saccharibacteria bacterium]